MSERQGSQAQRAIVVSMLRVIYTTLKAHHQSSLVPPLTKTSSTSSNCQQLLADLLIIKSLCVPKIQRPSRSYQTVQNKRHRSFNQHIVRTQCPTLRQRRSQIFRRPLSTSSTSIQQLRRNRSKAKSRQLQRRCSANRTCQSQIRPLRVSFQPQTKRLALCSYNSSNNCLSLHRHNNSSAPVPTKAIVRSQISSSTRCYYRK